MCARACTMLDLNLQHVVCQPREDRADVAFDEVEQSMLAERTLAAFREGALLGIVLVLVPLVPLVSHASSSHRARRYAAPCSCRCSRRLRALSTAHAPGSPLGPRCL